MRELIAEGRRLLDWYNQKVGRHAGRDFDVYDTEFDSGNEVSGGRWVRLFNRNVLVKPDGSMVGVPSALKNKPDPTRDSRRIYRVKGLRKAPNLVVQALKGQAITAAFNSGSRMSGADFWRLSSDPKALIEFVKGTPGVEKRAVEGLGEDWEKELRGEYLKELVQEGDTALDGLEAFGKPIADHWDEVKGTIEKDVQFQGSLRRQFGPNWKQVLRTLREDEAGAVSASLARELKTMRQPNLQTLRRMVDRVGSPVALSAMAKRHPKLQRELERMSVHSGDNPRTWQGRAFEAKAEPFLDFLEQAMPSRVKQAQGRLALKTSAGRTRFREVMEQHGVTVDGLIAAGNINPDIRKRMQALWNPLGDADSAFYEKTLEDAQEGLKAEERGEEYQANRAHAWVSEGSYKRKLDPGHYAKVMFQSRRKLDRMFSGKDPEQGAQAARMLLRELQQQGMRDRKMPHEFKLDSNMSSRLVHAPTSDDPYNDETLEQSTQDALKRFKALISPKSFGKPIDQRDVRQGFSRGDSITVGSTGNRGYFSPRERRLELGRPTDKADTDSVVFHEMGHYLEQCNGRNADACEYLLERRARRGAVENLRDIASKDYGIQEITQKDEFSSPYTGKVYPTYRSTEVLSMALQEFRDPYAMRRLYEKDPDLFALAYAAAKGLFGFRD